MGNMNSRGGFVIDDAGREGPPAGSSTVQEIDARASLDWSIRGLSSGALLRDLLNSESWRVGFLLVYDALVAGLAVKIGYALSPAYHGVARHADVATMVPIFAVTFLFVAFVWGLYESKCLGSPGSAIVSVAGAVVTSWVFLILVDYTLTYTLVGRWIVAISSFCLYGASVLPRIVLHLVSSDSYKRIILVGNMDHASLFDAAAKDRGDRPVKILQVFQAKSQTGDSPNLTSDLRDLCYRHEVDLIVAHEHCDDTTLAQVAACIGAGTQVCGFNHYYEHMFHKVPVDTIDVGWIFSANLHRQGPLSLVLKRGADLCLGGVGLVVTLPLWPVIALLVKATSPGPVFYTQRRVGQTGETFSLMKFRTMRNDAEGQGCPVWAAKGDPRVTFVGGILRRTRLDEIPQFLNVLRGDMSFVGPRPERPEFVGRLQETIPHYGLRHAIKPGITGWAQIMYRYGASEADAKEKLCYDLYYLKYGNLLLDVKILVRTLGAMMKGAR
jgi:exopolysaccharide biosynthesis polyprenyl glycosylphosphotransferase